MFVGFLLILVVFIKPDVSSIDVFLLFIAYMLVILESPCIYLFNSYICSKKAWSY